MVNLSNTEKSLLDALNDNTMQAEPKCMHVYGIEVCKGDYIEVYPRGRSLAVFRGFVKNVTISSIVLENHENDVAVRLSEIKIIRKLKPISK